MQPLTPKEVTKLRAKVVLRPLKQPCYDSEWLTPGKQYSYLRLFGRWQGQTFMDRMASKDIVHTNMNEANMLSASLEFSVFGFNYALADDVSAEDKAKIKTGSFSFIFVGNRVYLTCPLIGMPTERQRKPVQEVLDRLVAIQTEIDQKKFAASAEQERKDREALKEEAANEQLHDFTIGKATLRIRPGEYFAVQYDWPEPIIVSKPVLLYAFIEGLMWTPM